MEDLTGATKVESVNKKEPSKAKGVKSVGLKAVMAELAKLRRSDPTLDGIGDVEDGIPIDFYEHPRGFAKYRKERYPLKSRLLNMKVGQSFLVFSWAHVTRIRQYAYRIGVSMIMRKDIVLGIPDVYRFWKVDKREVGSDEEEVSQQKRFGRRRAPNGIKAKDVSKPLDTVLTTEQLADPEAIIEKPVITVCATDVVPQNFEENFEENFDWLETGVAEPVVPAPIIPIVTKPAVIDNEDIL